MRYFTVPIFLMVCLLFVNMMLLYDAVLQLEFIKIFLSVAAITAAVVIIICEIIGIFKGNE